MQNVKFIISLLVFGKMSFLEPLYKKRKILSDERPKPAAIKLKDNCNDYNYAIHGNVLYLKRDLWYLNTTQLAEMLHMTEISKHFMFNQKIHGVLKECRRLVITPLMAEELRNNPANGMELQLDYALEKIFDVCKLNCDRVNTIVLQSGNVDVTKFLSHFQSDKICKSTWEGSIGFTNVSFWFTSDDTCISHFDNVSNLFIEKCDVCLNLESSNSKEDNKLPPFFYNPVLLFRNITFLHLTSSRFVSTDFLKETFSQLQVNNGGLMGLCLEGKFSGIHEKDMKDLLSPELVGQHLERLGLIFFHCRYDKDRNNVSIENVREYNYNNLHYAYQFKNLRTLILCGMEWYPEGLFVYDLMDLTMESLDCVVLFSKESMRQGREYDYLLQPLEVYSLKDQKKTRLVQFFCQTMKSLPPNYVQGRYSITWTDKIIDYSARRLFFDKSNSWINDFDGKKTEDTRFFQAPKDRGLDYYEEWDSDGEEDVNCSILDYREKKGLSKRTLPVKSRDSLIKTCGIDFIEMEDSFLTPSTTGDLIDYLSLTVDSELKEDNEKTKEDSPKSESDEIVGENGVKRKKIPSNKRKNQNELEAHSYIS